MANPYVEKSLLKKYWKLKPNFWKSVPSLFTQVDKFKFLFSFFFAGGSRQNNNHIHTYNSKLELYYHDYVNFWCMGVVTIFLWDVKCAQPWFLLHLHWFSTVSKNMYKKYIFRGFYRFLEFFQFYTAIIVDCLNIPFKKRF